MLFRRKPKNIMRLTRVDSFNCEHVVTTFQFGGHPARVYAFCPFCKTYALLDWKDTAGRAWNRFFFSIPIGFTLLTAIVSIAFIVYSVLRALAH